MKRTENGSQKSNSLSDSIEKFTKATGIKKIVESAAKAAGSYCGCGKRKDALNRAFPYKK